MKMFKLNETQEIPALGFGTWQLEEACQEAVEMALKTGYRHIDTAAAYNNHSQVRKGIETSGLKRDELFITSKLWTADMHRADAIEAGHRALDELGVDFLDLYLVHWPDRKVPFEETISALLELKQNGLIKEWGVSNCTPHHLKDMIEKGFHPANNQVEFHPSLNQKELKAFCDQNNILLTAYSPIAQGADLKLPLIMKLAEKYKRSTSQVILNWIISKGIVAIPKASSRDHIEDNFKTLEWELEKEDVDKIDQLNSDNRVIIPEWADFQY